VKAGKGGKLSSDGHTHHNNLTGGEEFPGALDEKDPNFDHGEQEDKPAPELETAPAAADVDDIGDYFEQQSIFQAEDGAAAAEAPALLGHWAGKSAIDQLTGTWEVIDNGEMEEFMTAIGVGWLKRKAAVAITAMSTQVYKIKVDGKTVSIDNGKSENEVVCDGSEFTYKSTQGDAITTASLDGGKFVMTHQATEESKGGMVTSRFVEKEQLIQEVHHLETDITWRRVCKRVTE